MKLIKARIQNYRSIIDSGFFDIEELKTILVGPNEAGKTVLLQALQQLNKPDDIEGFKAIRDYPRSLFNNISTKKVKEEDVEVVRGYFKLDNVDKLLIPSEFKDCIYVFYKNLDNSVTHYLEEAPDKIKYNDIKKDLARMINHLDVQFDREENPLKERPSTKFHQITETLYDNLQLYNTDIDSLSKCLEEHYALVEEDNEKEENRYNYLLEKINFNKKHSEVLDILYKRLPVFVLFNNYFKVKPSIHLGHLALRQANNLLEDDKFYDYGNLCLLKLLGFTASELSNIGKTADPDRNDIDAINAYRDKLDSRLYQLNAASVRLTDEIVSIWNPNPNRPEAQKIRITADGQYLKVAVEDELGVEIELDQRSEGFQWIVSFFIVFFAEAMDKHKNAILLLDEPGMSLHGLKQRDFRDTISRLAEENQTIYTTHSPFMVGPDELDIVRVVELKNRREGTKIHTTISSSDPAGLLPLQEALGYDLAQSLFTQNRNLILEGITDYWYLEATAQLLKEAKIETLNDRISLIFANTAGKVVYYATILHANKLKVAALLDSDSAGDQAAKQENLVHTLGNKKILRTKEFTNGTIKPEIEDLLKDTLIKIAITVYDKDVTQIAKSHPNRAIVDIFKNEISDFSKYKMAKSYVQWTRNSSARDLTSKEIESWKALIDRINKVLK